MSKLVMYGTTLEEIEQLMVMMLNFQSKRSGIVINNYFNCEGGVKDCNFNLINFSNRCDDYGYIYLPCSDIEVEKALMRLETPYLHDCKVAVDSHIFSDSIYSKMISNLKYLIIKDKNISKWRII